MSAASRRCALLALTCWVGAAAAAGRGPDFAVCLLENNLPYSERASGIGFDVDVARAVAEAGGRELKPVWIAHDTGIHEIDESDLPVARLARGECDAIFSVPGPAESSLGGHSGLVLSAPYYGAAFELVACGAQPPTALDGLAGRAVAIQSQTVAHFALQRIGAEPRTHFSPRAAFLAVAGGEADAALLWGPAIGYLLRRARVAGELRRDPALAACRLVDAYAPPRALRWNLHVALAAAARRLREDVAAALQALQGSGALARIKADYGVPDRAPFDTVHRREDLARMRAR